MNDTLKMMVLETIPDKLEWNSTTSKQMKWDIINWCGDRFKDKVALEIGSHVGHTTMILGLLFKEVYTININGPESGKHSLFEPIENIEKTEHYSLTRCNIKNQFDHKFENIYHITQDAYDSRGWCPKIPDVDVSFIDCLHTSSAVQTDINNSIQKNAKYIIFDDYGRYKDVRNCVQKHINLNILSQPMKIGWPVGEYKFVESDQIKEFLDDEGVICKVR
jgi:hypothetical protein